MRSKLDTRGGFTLVELGVALAVAGLLALASMPSIVQYVRNSRLEGSASNLVGDIRLCRHRAVAESNDYIIALDPQTDTYVIIDDDNNNGVADAGEAIIGPVGLPGGLDLRNGPWNPFPNDELILHPNGTANATGSITIRNKNGRERMLFVSQATGHAKKLQEYQAEAE